MMAMSSPSILLLTIDWVPGRDVRGPWPLQLPSSLYLPFLFIPLSLPPALSLALSQTQVVCDIWFALPSQLSVSCVVGHMSMCRRPALPYHRYGRMNLLEVPRNTHTHTHMIIHVRNDHQINYSVP